MAMMILITQHHQLMVPTAGKYISASAGEYCSYLVRDDGVVCRTTSKGVIQSEMVPEHGKCVSIKASRYDFLWSRATLR